MIRAAIVEDDEREARALAEVLDLYGKEHGNAVECEIFLRPLEFLNNRKSGFDVVFMDIEMPDLSGLEAAQTLRGEDETVVIVFVTHMAQYAVKGYEVSASDFVVKPVKYADFLPVMARVERRLAVRKLETHSIRSLGGVTRVAVSEIVYVEVYKHRLFYHMVCGEVHEAWGTLLALEEELPARRFARCNNCYLVNLQYVRGVKDDVAYVGKERLRVSRLRKQEFIESLVAFTGE